ncbi:unnamed protein product [Tilletia caries]|nr:unnamed protein product [Tilletia caries]
MLHAFTTSLTIHSLLLLLCSLFSSSLCSDPSSTGTGQAPANPTPAPFSPSAAAPFHNPFTDPSSPPAEYLNLTKIRNVLERMEDLIILALIQRVQYPYDPSLYVRQEGKKAPKLDWFLQGEEALLALTGQWQLPDQVPFAPLGKLPQPVFSPLPQYPIVLHGSASYISLNAELKKAYLTSTLPSLNLPRQSPSAVAGPTLSADASWLHLLSSRIHLGVYVAESKYISNATLFTEPIRARDRTELNLLVTNQTVEDANVARVQVKATGYGAPAEAVGGLYRNVLIPLTKEVEVGYLLGRLS